MVDFTVWTKVERMEQGCYRATATASPWDVEQRCAPEERSLECPTPAAALAASRFLAESLRHDIVSRGNRVVEQARGAPAARARRRQTGGSMHPRERTGAAHGDR